ncbi:uracil-DNA glycosylase family protein [Leptobacterium flavescens]|uniref:Uracil-DNA glycosylase family protein n=1 Tax=Leptobacterium flavescens TaxID=472055 RepID=A0A6P0UQG4_9FLAO|nr:uracil-DNA glycosylase family protein [Leptobacterium flavescens]NER15197.1 uracil-DNA glycosylase family protein [Leptobacterium flavescens]
MKELLESIRNCTVCEKQLVNGVRPIVSVEEDSKIVIIGQAPGSKVHQTGVPWDDPSGRRLRQWLGVSDEDFYDAHKFALIPMGFCYPGKGKSGDLPPRPECAPLWHKSLLDRLKDVKLVILIGQYAQKYYLGEKSKRTLTETVRSFEDYLPHYIPLPHPSPRNQIWMKKNEWFEREVLDVLEKKVSNILS